MKLERGVTRPESEFTKMPGLQRPEVPVRSSRLTSGLRLRGELGLAGQDARYPGAHISKVWMIHPLKRLVGSSLTTYVSTTTGDAGLCVQVRCRFETELVELLAAIREHVEVLSIQVNRYERIVHNIHAPTLQAEDQFSLDETDMRLIETLERDGRAPVRVLAEALRVPESSARHRMTRLIEGEIIRVVAVPNRNFGRAHTIALGLGIRHKGGSGPCVEVLSKLGVEFIATTTGDFGVIATAVFNTLREADDFVEVLRREPRIVGLSTWIHMQILKEDYSVAEYRDTRQR